MNLTDMRPPLPRRHFLRVGDVTRTLSLDPKTVGALFEPDGTRRGGARLHGFEFTGRGSGSRPHKRIRRDSVTLFLIEHSNELPDELRSELIDVLRTLPRPALVSLRAALA